MAANDAERGATVHQLMCKSAFVKNIQRSGSCGSRLSGVRSHRQPAITSDIAYQMVMDLSRPPSQKNQDWPVSEIVTSERTSKLKTSSPSLMATLSSSTMAQPRQEQRHNGFRRDYDIGQAIRSPEHMIIEPTPERTIDAVASLRKHDFAWVKRSDGSYTYAIVACPSEDSLIFLIDLKGSTKKVSRKYWSKSVRIVSPLVPNPSGHHHVVRPSCFAKPLDQLPEAMESKCTDVPPLYVTFDDDSSFISDVSLPSF